MPDPAGAPPDPRQRFSDRVDDYVRYRPDYPAAVFGFLSARVGLGPGSGVADVGAGTGIFTRQLLATGASVYAVEPNDAMRAAADAALHGQAGYRSLKGGAEESGCPTARSTSSPAPRPSTGLTCRAAAGSSRAS